MFCKLSNFDNLCLQIGDLNSIYEEVCARSGDVDERDFFDKNGYLWIPFNEEPSEVGHGRYKRSHIYPTSNFFLQNVRLVVFDLFNLVLELLVVELPILQSMMNFNLFW